MGSAKVLKDKLRKCGLGGSPHEQLSQEER